MPENKVKLAINLVTYNAERYLPYCLESIAKQTFQDFSFLVIDNGSSDNTVRYFKEDYPHFKIITHKDNIGFAKAHNQGIAWTKSDYICLLNQDVILEPDYFAKALDFLDKNPQASSLSGKILLWDFPHQQKTEIIDSLGLRVFKNHRIVEKGQGEKDKNQYSETVEIFGVSGALPIYRRTALEKIKVKVGNLHDEYFDELFFSYKEDVDLAFRLRLAGFKAYYLPEAIAYHHRSVKGSVDLSDKAVRQSRKEKNRMIKLYSYKNHLLVILKNEFTANLVKFFFPIFWYEFKKFIFILLFEQTTLKGLRMFFKEKAKIKEKKKFIIKEIRKVSAAELAKWYE
ncbi:glycosyltransferase family 2 protein [Patescibacteria group bacterium]|nr:glycosyltransferase family 2 protein [Patescibacteria group bacterium]